MRWLTVLVLAGCGELAADPNPPAGNNATLTSVGLEPALLDRSADPCTNFYQYACGGWLKGTGTSRFAQVDARNVEYEHKLLETARTNGSGLIEGVLGPFYGSCMDEAEIEKVGVKPIASLITAISNVRNDKSLSAALAAMQANGVTPLFSFAASPDQKSTNVILEIESSGLGLPSSDYAKPDRRAVYEKSVAWVLGELYPKAIALPRAPEPATAPNGYRCGAGKPIVGKGCSCVGGMVSARDGEGDAICVAGVEPAPNLAKLAGDVVALEAELAKTTLDPASRRDPQKVYHPVDQRALDKLAPHIDWAVLWTGLAIKPRTINLVSQTYVVELDKVIGKTPPAVWRGYLLAVLAKQLAPLLPKRFGEHFPQPASAEPRWRQCLVQTREQLRDVLGQAFVRDRFPGDARTIANRNTTAIVAAVGTAIERNGWMTSATRIVAQRKLRAIGMQLGYPTRWWSTSLRPDPKAWTANGLAARRENLARELAQIDKLTNPDEWLMGADIVNMYFDPSRNLLAAPAGILQPPFFSPTASAAVQLGGIGVFLGHELTHGFDEFGAQYDEAGRIASWWDAETRRQYTDRTRCFVDQYSAFTVAGTNVNGKLTLDENIADAGGVKVALAAYRAVRSGPAIVADGFTEDQQFFLGFAQAMCRRQSDAQLQTAVAVDPHAPAQWRVNGSLSMLPDFAKAFSCKPGAAMAVAKRCEIW